MFKIFKKAKKGELLEGQLIARFYNAGLRLAINGELPVPSKVEASIQPQQILPKDLLNDLEKGDRTMEMLKDDQIPVPQIYGRSIIPGMFEEMQNGYAVQNQLLRQSILGGLR